MSYCVKGPVVVVAIIDRSPVADPNKKVPTAEYGGSVTFELEFTIFKTFLGEALLELVNHNMSSALFPATLFWE